MERRKWRETERNRERERKKNSESKWKLGRQKDKEWRI